MKRFSRLLLCTVLLMTLAMTFATGVSFGKEKARIVFAVNEQPLLPLSFWKAPAEKYMKLHPDVTIEVISQPSSNMVMRDFLKTLLATGQFPDVMVMASPGDFISSGALLPLKGTDVSPINPKYLYKSGGKIYVMPSKVQIGGVFYNKKIFAENGLQEPKNWKEFIQICEKLQCKGITPISLGVKDGWPQVVLFTCCMTNSDFLGKNPKWPAERNQGKRKFTDPEFVQGVKKYQFLTSKYCNKDLASVSYTQMQEIFFSGKAAMYVMGSWAQGDEQRLKHNFEVGFFALPGEKNNKVLPIWGQEGYSISAKTKYPKVAKDFCRFLVSDPEWYAQYLRTEMLFSPTKADIPYEMSALRKEIGAKIGQYTPIQNFYDSSGDNALLPGLQSFLDKMTVKIAADPATDIMEQLKLFDKEWEMANANLKK